MISQALYKLIATSSAQLAIDIRAGLSQFDFGTGNAPAIFSNEHTVPDNMATPYIVVGDVSGAPDFGCRQFSGGTFVADAQIFGKKDFSGKPVRDLALKLWKLIDRADLSTWLAPLYLEQWGVSATLPMATNDGLGFPGWTIRTNVRVLRTSASA